MTQTSRSHEEVDPESPGRNWKRKTLTIVGAAIFALVVSILEISNPIFQYSGIPWTVFYLIITLSLIGFSLLLFGVIYGSRQFMRRQNLPLSTKAAEEIGKSGKPFFQNTFYRYLGTTATFVIVAGFLYTPLSQQQLTQFVSFPIGLAVSLVVFFKWTVYRFFNDRIEISRNGRVLQTVPYFDVLDFSLGFNTNFRRQSAQVTIRLREEEYSNDSHTNSGNITIQDLQNRKLHLFLSTWLNSKLGQVEAHENRIHHQNRLNLESSPHLVVPIEEHRKNRREELRKTKRKNNEIAVVGFIVGLLLVVGSTAIILQGQPVQKIVQSLIVYLIASAIGLSIVGVGVYFGWKLR
ncbi:MAG: hypothetical protein ACYC7D_13025 [Nitrososphaerales archaeon]